MNQNTILIDNAERYLVNDNQYKYIKIILLKQMNESIHTNYKIYETYHIEDKEGFQRISVSALRESYESKQLKVVIDSKLTMSPRSKSYSIFNQELDLFSDMYLIQVKTLETPLWFKDCLKNNQVSCDSFITYQFALKQDISYETRTGLIYI